MPMVLSYVPSHTELVKDVIELTSLFEKGREKVPRTGPQNIGGKLRTLSGFLRNNFWKRTSQKSPEIYSGKKILASIFSGSL